MHRQDCPNVQLSADQQSRLIEVEWEENITESGKQYNADLEIYGYDRKGFLNDILQVISALNMNVINVNGGSTKNKMALLHVTISIKSKHQLEKVVDKIKTVPEVYSVRRTNG